MNDEINRPTEGRMDEDTRKKLEQIYTDPDAYRAKLVDSLKCLAVSNLDRLDQSRHGFNQMFGLGGYWDGILKEKDGILLEGLGPNYRNHPRIAEIEVMVLVNLGQLQMIRNKDSIQALMNGVLR